MGGVRCGVQTSQDAQCPSWVHPLLSAWLVAIVSWLAGVSFWLAGALLGRLESPTGWLDLLSVRCVVGVSGCEVQKSWLELSTANM